MALNIKNGSLCFAPMEGVTDEDYRTIIDKIFPSWDYYSTDFIRVPTQGNFSTAKIIKHYGEKTHSNSRLRNKTSLQILTTAKAQTKLVIDCINKTNITHLDLNLGCPSKKVNAHLGGAYLLSDLRILEKVIKEIRNEYKKTFTVKIRLGYRNTDQFFDSIKLFNDCGVDAITIHGRTRDELYKGKANWKLIKEAVKHSKVPIIGNGDLWKVQDIINMFNETGCHSVMLGRGALKTPWLAELFEEYKDRPYMINDDLILHERANNLQIYFMELEKVYLDKGFDSLMILKRFKNLSHHLFLDYRNNESIRSDFLRSRELNEFNSHLSLLSEKV